MIQIKEGSIAVIFSSQRTDADPEGYEAAAAEMAAAVTAMPGFLGMESVRSPDGCGITVSYWEDEQSIAEWRNHARHTEVRGDGRNHWYDGYRVTVARVNRAYDWDR